MIGVQVTVLVLTVFSIVLVVVDKNDWWFSALQDVLSGRGCQVVVDSSVVVIVPVHVVGRCIVGVTYNQDGVSGLVVATHHCSFVCVVTIVKAHVLVGVVTLASNKHSVVQFQLVLVDIVKTVY